MSRYVLAVFLVVGVWGGKSPNADYVEDVLRLHPGFTYSDSVLEDAKLDVPNLARKYGYPIEEHDVITKDEYMLTMHRMAYGKDQNNGSANKKVAFLMHGLLSSSADFLALGPRNALAYYLADEGYDVWMGNARGNYYSRRHRTLNPDNRLNQAFWKFSWDEIGNYDLPAFIDYITRVTGQQKLHYIGHSQGGTAFLVLNSLRPEYNNKFISFQGLAPASFFVHNIQAFTVMAQFEKVLEPQAFVAGLGGVFRDRKFSVQLASKFCQEGFEVQPMCDSILMKGTPEYYNRTMFPMFIGDAPAGASIRQFAHYAQSIRFKGFRRYSHNNPLTNLAIYGSIIPPSYNLSRITVPSYIHYGNKDILVHHKDAQMLGGMLPNLRGSYLVDTFNHLDFIWGNGVHSRVYVKVLEQMREAEENNL